jgi:hypothetical protein
MTGKERLLFLKKKKQKDFVVLASLPHQARSSTDKAFLVLFSRKKNSSFLLPPKGL